MITWIDKQGVAHNIKDMSTSYIENCLSFIDERIATLVKRGHVAYSELSLKREQKIEMMRILESRRVQNQRVSPVTPYSCYNCANSDTTFNELICRKNSIFCRNVNFTCGAWEEKRGKIS